MKSNNVPRYIEWGLLLGPNSTSLMFCMYTKKCIHFENCTEHSSSLNFHKTIMLLVYQSYEEELTKEAYLSFHFVIFASLINYSAH